MGIRAYGENEAQAFEQEALALTTVITDPAGVTALEVVETHCDVADCLHMRSIAVCQVEFRPSDAR